MVASSVIEQESCCKKQPYLGAAKILGFTGRVANTSAPPVGGSGERLRVAPTCRSHDVEDLD